MTIITVRGINMSNTNKQNTKTEYKPNYAVHPIEFIEEMAVIKLFGEKLAQDFEIGITDKNAYLLEAMFKMPRKFWLTLQKSYDETTERLKHEK